MHYNNVWGKQLNTVSSPFFNTVESFWFMEVNVHGLSTFGWSVISWVMGLLHYNILFYIIKCWLGFKVNVKNSLKTKFNCYLLQWIFIFNIDSLQNIILFYFVCLFRVTRSTQECFTICHHYRKRATILTNARHWRPLSNECSLAWHTYCDTGHPFIVVSEDPWHSHLLPSVWHNSIHHLY